MCTKLSGEAVQFSKREKFDSIVRHLTARCLPYLLFVVCRVYIEWTTSNRKVPFPIKYMYLLTPLVQGAYEDE